MTIKIRTEKEIMGKATVKEGQKTNRCCHVIPPDKETILRLYGINGVKIGWRCSECGLLVYRRELDKEELIEEIEAFKAQSSEFIEEIHRRKEKTGLSGVGEPVIGHKKTLLQLIKKELFEVKWQLIKKNLQ
jgi:hypothetical protein